MPKTLVGAKPELEQDLKTILQAAAYAAFLTANTPAGADEAISSFVTKTMTDAAQKFSDKFAETAYQPLANAIYKYVKEIGITATPKALMSPHVPVTGSIMLNEFTII